MLGDYLQRRFLHTPAKINSPRKNFLFLTHSLIARMESYHKSWSRILTRFSNIVIIPKIKSTSNKFLCFFPFSAGSLVLPPPWGEVEKEGRETCGHGQTNINKKGPNKQRTFLIKRTWCDSKTEQFMFFSGWKKMLTKIVQKQLNFRQEHYIINDNIFVLLDLFAASLG